MDPSVLGTAPELEVNLAGVFHSGAARAVGPGHNWITNIVGWE